MVKVVMLNRGDKFFKTDLNCGAESTARYWLNAYIQRNKFLEKQGYPSLTWKQYLNEQEMISESSAICMYNGVWVVREGSYTNEFGEVCP